MCKGKLLNAQAIIRSDCRASLPLMTKEESTIKAGMIVTIVMPAGFRIDIASTVRSHPSHERVKIQHQTKPIARRQTAALSTCVIAVISRRLARTAAFFQVRCRPLRMKYPSAKKPKAMPK
jgi:hypothetical protein